MGFVALLGIISLAGMIMRNSGHSVDQIQQTCARPFASGTPSSNPPMRRMRPITLTAARRAGMIPLSARFSGADGRVVYWAVCCATSSRCFFAGAVCGVVQVRPE